MRAAALQGQGTPQTVQGSAAVVVSDAGALSLTASRSSLTVGETVQLISENQSVYIPLGNVHRLTNPGAIPLEIIEVQSGSYLGEDDIVRFQDNYGRTS